MNGPKAESTGPFFQAPAPITDYTGPVAFVYEIKLEKG